jgi:hypothetical protein
MSPLPTSVAGPSVGHGTGALLPVPAVGTRVGEVGDPEQLKRNGIEARTSIAGRRVFMNGL